MTRRHRNVYRYEHNFFRGWVVSVKRAGARHGRYFSDSTHGSRGAALGAALAYRNKLLAALPMPSKVKKSYVLNKTGVVGVALVKDRTRKGTPVSYYVASWSDTFGRKHKRSFSVLKYGEERARALAVEARRRALG